jgi:hypothetical protein
LGEVLYSGSLDADDGVLVTVLPKKVDSLPVESAWHLNRLIEPYRLSYSAPQPARLGLVAPALSPLVGGSLVKAALEESVWL